MTVIVGMYKCKVNTVAYWENWCVFAIFVLNLDLFNIFKLKQPMKVEHDHWNMTTGT